MPPLEEPLSVLTPRGTPVTDADRTIVSVVSHSGEEYRVDVREGRCTCPDHEHRDARCKHIHRARVALAARRFRPTPSPLWTRTRTSARTPPGPAVTTADGGTVEAGDEGEILTDDSSADDGPI